MIGIFDSGIGGLTVVRALRRLDPRLDILYLGDTARLPYGTKSPETIRRYALEDARYLVNAGATVLVVACNTMSAVAVDGLRKEFPDVPLFEVITPAVSAARVATQGRIGVIGTRATIASGIYERLLKNFPTNPPLLLKREEKINSFLPLKPGGGEVGVCILSRACPLFVPLVEEGWSDQPETKRIAKHYLQNFKTSGVDTLILGCTHYPFLRGVIAQVMGRRVKLIDPADSVAQEVIMYLREHPALYKSVSTNGTLEVCLTDQTPHIAGLAQQWLARPKLATKLIHLTP